MSRSQVNLWFVFWPVQILAVLGLIFTSPEWLYLFLGWVIFCGLGSAVILHRVVSHGSIKLKSVYSCWRNNSFWFINCSNARTFRNPKQIAILQYRIINYHCSTKLCHLKDANYNGSCYRNCR